MNQKLFVPTSRCNYLVIKLQLLMGDFQDILKDARSATTTEHTCLIFTISESFQMRYCMTLYLKGYQKYKSKLKAELLLSKYRHFYI